MARILGVMEKFPCVVSAREECLPAYFEECHRATSIDVDVVCMYMCKYTHICVCVFVCQHKCVYVQHNAHIGSHTALNHSKEKL